MKYLLVILISIFFFALTYASAPDEFNIVDISSILGLLAIAFGIEILIAHRFNRYLVVQNLILGFFTTLNILYLNLILNELFINIQGYLQLSMLLLSLFIVTTFMNMLDDDARFARIIPTFFIFAILGVLAQPLFSVAHDSDKSNKGKATSAENIRTVDFKRKPNVYFISFDSLIPRVLLQKHLSLEGAAYHDILDTNFRRFKNFFSDGALTMESLNSLLALDLRYFKKATLDKNENLFFPGLAPSPLLEIFKHNGYETTTLHDSFYLGKEKGPYVDNYRVNGYGINNVFCNFIDVKGWRSPTFMGYCSLLKSWTVRNILTKFGIINKKKEDIDFLIDYMRAGLTKNVPQFFVAYIWSPGHTLASKFDRKEDELLDEYKQTYLKNSEITAEHLNKIITFINKEDPNAILYVFGDHGPYISRRDAFENDKVFFVQDRFGVYGGIYPPERCKKSFTAPYNKNFMTVVQGAHMIIRCLSSGENAFLILEDYRLPKPITKDYNHYESYLYE